MKQHRPLDGPGAILFDAEGVVIDTEPMWDKSQEILMARRGLKYDRGLLKPLMAGRTIEEGVAVMKAHFPLDEPVPVLARERRALITELMEREVRFIPGFLQFLEQIDKRGFKMAIATSLESRLLQGVESRLGLRALFHGHVYSIADVDNRSKPDPAIFVFAASMLQMKPQQCLVLEDAPHGIEAAKRAGMACWALAGTFGEDLLHGADRIFTSYEAIGKAFFAL